MVKKPKKKIALIGPTDPYRGGVAQYTTQLHRALRDRSELTTISFKRQYPTWLYPSKTYTEPSPSELNEEGVEYLIDAYNPLSWRRAADMIVRNECSLVILDWWTLFWQPGFVYIVRRLRKKGVKTVYLCHNIKDHKTGGFMGFIDSLATKLSEWMFKQADAYIVQSSEHKVLVKNLCPQAEVILCIPPIYSQFPVATKSLPKRGRLELLFFGFIRPYKGLEVLMKALAELNDHEVYLTVVGEPWGRLDEVRRRLLEFGVPNVQFELRYVDDHEAANYFKRADIVVLPYLSATGSAVVALAYNYGKPVIATSVGGLKDAVINEQTGWLIKEGSSEALVDIVGRLGRREANLLEPMIESFCKKHSWDGMAKRILKELT